MKSEVYVSLLHVNDKVKAVRAFFTNKIAESWGETEDSMISILPGVDYDTISRTTMLGSLVISGVVDRDEDEIKWPEKVWITIQVHKDSNGETIITPKVFLDESDAKDLVEIQEKRAKVALKEELQITLFESVLDSTIMA